MSDSRSETVLASKPLAALRTACEVTAYIVDANACVESLSLVTYHERSTWRDLSQPGEDNDLPMLLSGVQQDAGERIFTKLLRKEISGERLRAIARGLGGHQLLGVVSKVSLAGGGSAHIPMMDFMCSPSTRNLEVLRHLLREVRQRKGFLLESGRSYHYYGVELISDEEWRVFLGKCLLMSDYVDDRYIGHQLVDGHCILRLSVGKSRASVPKVVAWL